MEIGSVFELNPKLLSGDAVGTAACFGLGEAEKYHKKHIRFTASGREAIALALKSFAQEHPDASRRCLLPAYMCDSVFFPFERAGWELHFYHLDRRLEVNKEELDELIGQIGPTLIFIHPYYGVDTWRSVRSFFHGWREQGICLMEDVTQSYYLENAGREVDYCVGSLRKWYAVPDGGFVSSDGELSEELSVNEEFARSRRELLCEKWEYLHGRLDSEARQALKADYLRKNRETERRLDDYEGIRAMSGESVGILLNIDEKECRERRRENCKYLHENIGGRTQVVPVFGRECKDGNAVDGTGAGEEDSISDGRDMPDDALGGNDITEAAPLYYPVYAAARDDLQKFLAHRSVYAPTLWPVGEANRDILTREERYIYDHILALPVDQRYGREEMQRILELLDQYEAERGPKAPAFRPMSRTDHAAQVIGIRVDANETIATGHVMRCITIARKLLRAGSRVIFYTADAYAGDMLAQAGMESVCLHTRWDDMEREIPLLREELLRAGCRKLLTDSYQATEKYFAKLRDICRLIYIDDCFDAVYPVDMIVNYNAYHVRFPYENAYAGRAKLLLGTSYVPLREEFGDEGGTAADGGMQRDGEWEGKGSVAGQGKDHDRNNASGGLHVLLSSGGGDPCNALADILRTAVRDETLRRVTFHTVVGGFNRDVEELKRLAAEHPNIRLYERVDKMAQLMRGCTAAVSAAGTMLFELSAMQTPTVFFVSADNQQYDHEFFAQEERMLYAGDIREDRERCLGEICRQLGRMLEDEGMRERMKGKLHEVTDGKGAMRIAAAILGL